MVLGILCPYYYFKTEISAFLNLLFLSGCFYFGQRFEENFPKLLLLAIVIATTTIVGVANLVGIKTYLFPYGVFYGTILIFIGTIFFGKKAIMKR